MVVPHTSLLLSKSRKKLTENVRVSISELSPHFTNILPIVMCKVLSMVRVRVGASHSCFYLLPCSLFIANPADTHARTDCSRSSLISTALTLSTRRISEMDLRPTPRVGKAEPLHMAIETFFKLKAWRVKRYLNSHVSSVYDYERDTRNMSTGSLMLSTTTRLGELKVIKEME